MTPAPGSYYAVPKPIAARRNVTPTAKLLYAYLSDRQGTNGRAWPGLERIAEDIGCAVSTAIRAIRDLESKGLISVRRPTSRIGNKASEYTVKGTSETLVLAKRYQGTSETLGQGTSETLVQLPHTTTPLTTPSINPLTPLPESSDLFGTDSTPKPDAPKPPAKRRKPPADDPLALALEAMGAGSPLDTPAFREAWGCWATHRREIHKPLTPQSVKGQIRQLSGWGHDGAIKSIRASIAGGWQGLFEPKPNGNGYAKRKGPEKLEEQIELRNVFNPG